MTRPRILHATGIVLAVAATPAVLTGHPLGLAAAFGSGIAFVFAAAHQHRALTCSNTADKEF